MKISGYLFLFFLASISIAFLIFLGIDLYRFTNHSRFRYQEDNSIKIVVTADDNFITPLGVLLTSISLNTKNSVEVSILTRGFNEKNTLFLKNLQQKLSNIKVTTLFIDPTIDFKDFPVRQQWNESIYYRYLILNHPYFSTLDKIIYLDADIVVLKDLKDYYEIDLKDNFMAGRKDFGAYLGENLPYPFETKLYVNGGSLLLNLKKMRAENIYPLLFETTLKYKSKLHYQDQDVMNFLFKGKIKELPAKYNGNIVFEVPFKKIIYHYLGFDKPWKVYSVDFHEWYKYQSFQNAILNNESFPLSDYLTYHIDKILYYFNFLSNKFFFQPKTLTNE